MMHRFTIASLAALGGLALLPVRPPADPAPLRGFTAASSAVERNWEAKFDVIPSPERMRANMKLLTARPHHVGSPYDKQNAEWLLAQFKSWGWDAHIENFYPLFPTPKERLVELTAPTHYKAKLAEPPVPGDTTSYQTAEALPPYNAYSIDGDVTGPLVFVNRGLQEDYDELARHGVSVKGAIVIAKYGGSWRGIKPKIAAEHGAIGCLIYSDPADDGYADEAVFPKGPMRPPQGVQRGSVMDMTLYPGDPLTPGIPATKDAKRLSIQDSPTITKIPVLPLSYGDAQPLLEAMSGPVAPSAWRGGLPITYRLGGQGVTRVHLVVKSNWDIKPLYDVIARLPGTTQADQWVIRANHHDAWVNGAADPISGLVSELEEARALGQLYQQGWRPKRTIIYAAWDGEEPMLLGSTEWAEMHADELSRHAVAYINTDNTGRGFFYASGSHSLEALVNEVEKDVTDPETSVSIYRRSEAARAARGAEGGGRGGRGGRGGSGGSDGGLPIGALGSGSDYTPFLQHLGIASLNLGFGGEDPGGVYHSAYDDFYWFTHFSDTSFVYGKALAQATGRIVMRLSGADVLPFVFTNQARTFQEYADQLVQLRDQRASQIAAVNKAVKDGDFALASDPWHPTFPPKVEVPPPQFNFAPLLNAMDTLTAAARDFEAAYKGWDRAATLPDSVLQGVNVRLFKTERDLTSTAGLPRRPWYRHLIYAPGFYTGYGVKTMPGPREAIEQGEWSAVDPQIQRVADALMLEAGLISDAAKVLSGGK
ncbi:MAG TPA: transferrin receptor-like dimerization domain-containing protein [Gemmatimonadaceae bacterium]|nr:transferrin receptor-like dimerization domain-containing protein [Gemmatimonadaceae bacterium]